MDVDGRTLNVFQNIEDNVSLTISSWKFNNINQVWKMKLINGILVAYASHIMATFLITKKILQSITSKLPKFWWTTSYEKKTNLLEEEISTRTIKHRGGARS